MIVLYISRTEKISMKMQVVIWFAGLRGAIAFALSQYVEVMMTMYLESSSALMTSISRRNMPGAHRDLYVSTTLCGESQYLFYDVFDVFHR